MIFQFARLLRDRARALPPIEEDPANDAPPERFVAKVSDEAGDVYLAPVIETLREALRKHRQPSSCAPETGSPDQEAERA